MLLTIEYQEGAVDDFDLLDFNIEISKGLLLNGLFQVSIAKIMCILDEGSRN